MKGMSFVEKKKFFEKQPEEKFVLKLFLKQ